MPYLVRSWNLFHGNSHPPGRRSHLRRMVELAAADRPAVLCVQEVPVWALARIDDWADMHRVSVVTRPPLWPGPSSGWVTRVHQGLFRSAFAGQANAILLDRGLPAEDLGHARISEHGLERRLVQAVRVDGLGVVANLHASSVRGLPEVAAADLRRAREWVESVARSDEVVILAGDFNLRAPVLPEYSPPGPGIDHVLVRGGACSPLVVWPAERRTVAGVVLSDHAPVELVVD